MGCGRTDRGCVPGSTQSGLVGDVQMAGMVEEEEERVGDGW